MPDAQESERSGRRWTRAALAVLAVPAALLFAGRCRSIGKPDLEQRLRKLGKNAALGELQRTSFRADLGGGQQEFELVFHRAPARAPGDGVPVVLIHNTPSTLFSWTELIYGREDSAGGEVFGGLCETRDVYAIEIIGHGCAPGEAAPYTFERCARFVAAAIRALELERIHLVGSSYGGEFAWRAALNEPARIASLTLLDPSGVPRRDQDWLSEELVMRKSGLAKIGWVLNSRDRIRSALAPHFRQLPPDRVEEFFLVCGNSENWAAMVDLARDENGTRASELGDIAAPTLVVWGQEDLAYPVDVYAPRFESEIPNATLVVVPESGHYPHEERPAEVARTLSAFFDEHSR